MLHLPEPVQTDYHPIDRSRWPSRLSFHFRLNYDRSSNYCCSALEFQLRDSIRSVLVPVPTPRTTKGSGPFDPMRCARPTTNSANRRIFAAPIASRPVETEGRCLAEERRSQTSLEHVSIVVAPVATEALIPDNAPCRNSANWECR